MSRIPKKDVWDKLSIVSSMVSNLIIIAGGIIFTYFYQERTSRELLLIQKNQNRMKEFEIVSDLIQKVSNSDENTKKNIIETVAFYAGKEAARKIQVTGITKKREMVAHVEWSYSPPVDPPIVGYRVYMVNESGSADVLVAETMNPLATSMDFPVLLSENHTTNFVLTALYSDGTETSRSEPFSHKEVEVER